MRKKIECLERLFALLKCKSDILMYLKEDGVISDDAMQRLMNEHHTLHSNKIATLLEDALKDGRLQLVDYEWTILPVELVKLTLVSNRSKKEFCFTL